MDIWTILKKLRNDNSNVEGYNAPYHLSYVKTAFLAPDVALYRSLFFLTLATSLGGNWLAGSHIIYFIQETATTGLR